MSNNRTATARVIPINHPRAIEARRGNMNWDIMRNWNNRYPDYTPIEDLPQNLPMSWPEMQLYYAATLQPDEHKLQRELNAKSRNRQIQMSHVSPDDAAVLFTHGSGWFKQAIQSDVRVYGYNRFHLEPSRFTNR